MRYRSVSTRSFLVLLLCCLPAANTSAEKNGAEVTLNLKEADIATLIATVSEVTGRNFVVDPRVKGKVTVVSSSPMDADAVYATFLSVLAVNGYAAVPAGATVKIVPDANARSEGGAGSGGGAGGDELVTRVFDIHNGSATQLVAILRPLVAQSGQIAAYASGNSLIVSDRAANVERLRLLIGQMDRDGDRGTELVALQNAGADEVVRVLTALTQQARQADPGAAQPVVIADTRSNSVLVGGDGAERGKLLALIRQLDQPGRDGGDTQVVYLKYADAESLAPILTGNAQPAARSTASTSGGSSMFGGSSGGPSSAASSFGAASKSSGSGAAASGGASGSNATVYNGSGANADLRVIADRDTNALVITAPPKTMQQIRNVIAQLDIRRAQVLVEAVIAEVSADKSSDIGVDWLAYNPNAIAAAGILNSSTSSALSSAASSLSSSSSSTISTSTLASAAASALGTGGTALVGISTSNGSIYGALIKALLSDSDTNILSMPSLVTLDNQEAKIEVGQSVPEVTGSYSNTGTSSNGSVNPFQTVDRTDVGLKLGITPTIGEGNTIRMKLEFENSTIASGTAGTSSLVTNKRTVSNTVSIEGGQILVIGGLIDDQVDDAVTRIPLLSDIPWLGALFKSRSVSRTKRNLMIFLHPVILRERQESDYFTRRKYESTRQAQTEAANGPAPVLGGRPPVLYHYDEYMQRNNLPQAGAPESAAPEDAPPTPP
ncbi:type II secretion system secretin GspD [Nevskia soli]|uniref:type II secretion system secretin GspD n=1 Tax=Nevskia soli TaxID=418856 RepID=UPI00068A914A|nr:type II secretion system secretin GspD [Nevskia soli]